MDKEKRIIKNDFSLFQFLCIKCSKLLKIMENEQRNPDKMILSENCYHHFCEECIKCNSCPICRKQIKLMDEDVENWKDDERKEYLEVLANKFNEIYKLKDSLRLIRCNKRLVKTCNSDCLILCSICFTENENKNADENSEANKKQLEISMFCKSCGFEHFRKNPSHVLTVIDNLQADYLDCCKENIDLINQNIKKIDNNLADIDSFLNKYNSEIDINFEVMKKEYYVIGNEYNQLNQNKNSDNENLVKKCIDHIDENKGIMNEINEEIIELTKKIEKVEKDHDSRHNMIKSYNNNRANKIWKSQYDFLSKNLYELNEIQFKYQMKKLEVSLCDIIFDTNTKYNLNNFLKIDLYDHEYDVKDFHNTNLQFKIYEQENDN